ncbi:Thioredoxin-like fold protein [Actinidia chinensis var. chinensis]|uniref:Thioredoxin-like fold protein n=1 Tax=Actinidia chinensis var. chinensis TaxID=1590841 RepID=A0A2R6QVR7_ACTCC|nr:Thioredoxin-like fold protein [Actinidia chinensis var. chinensis]
MKGMKGRFLRKLKSISTITALRQGISFQANPSTLEKDQAFGNNIPQVIKYEEDIDSSLHVWGKENFLPSKEEFPIPLEHGSNTNACTVPLPKVQVLKASETCDFEANPLLEEKSVDEEFLTLLDFEEKCPPGGNQGVVLYTTSLRGIRKTFEDCNSIRFLLESLRVVFHERDVSMHLEFREELWRILGGRVVPPRLFIKGRLIGGADEVVGLHERGSLRKLLCGLPLNLTTGPCGGCAGVRFVVCLSCNGSRKIVSDALTGELTIRCSECNENGLIKCPICW